MKETKDQIDRIYAEAAKAGRPETDRPRIWVTFRPIVAETDEVSLSNPFPNHHQLTHTQLAWKKAHATLAALQSTYASPAIKETRLYSASAPQNVGSQRLLDIAAKGEVQDRALWYPTVTATNARGASTALVGSYETAALALLDYVDLGAELLSIRGYDNFNDVVDYGRFVLPLVRDGLEERKRRGEVVPVREEVKENGENGVIGEEKPSLKEKVVDGLKGLSLNGHSEKEASATDVKEPEVQAVAITA